VSGIKNKPTASAPCHNGAINCKELWTDQPDNAA